MANQPSQVRPWFRLGSIRAPPPAPPPAAQPRPGLQTRPTFRGVAPQFLAPPSSEPAPTPASGLTAAEPVATAPPPSSPVVKPSAISASLPTSPVKNAASPPRTVLPVPDVSSLPSSPEIKASAPSSSVTTSPIRRQFTTNVTSDPSSPPVDKVPASPPPAVLPSTTVASVPSYVPTSPAQKSAQYSFNSESPKKMQPSVKTPIQSPKLKVTAPPPSPLTLPPPQLKPREDSVPKIPVQAEQKTVLIQKTIENPKSLHNGNGGDWMKNSSGEVRKSSIPQNGRKVSDSSRIVTLAGENKGAVMDLIQSPNRHGLGSTPKNLHENNGNSITRKVGGFWGHHGNSSGNEDDNMKRKDKSHEGETKDSSPLTTYTNSNVQGINNSIMYGAKCIHNNPGVHLNLSKKPFIKQLERNESVTDYHHD